MSSKPRTHPRTVSRKALRDYERIVRSLDRQIEARGTITDPALHTIVKGATS